jgi:hypothetical protein
MDRDEIRYQQDYEYYKSLSEDKNKQKNKPTETIKLPDPIIVDAPNPTQEELRDIWVKRFDIKPK